MAGKTDTQQMIEQIVTKGSMYLERGEITNASSKLKLQMLGYQARSGLYKPAGEMPETAKTSAAKLPSCPLLEDID